MGRATSRCRIAVLCAVAPGPVMSRDPTIRSLFRQTGCSRSAPLRVRGAMMPNRDATQTPDTATLRDAAAARQSEERLERLIARLPDRLQTTVRWLRRLAPGPAPGRRASDLRRFSQRPAGFRAVDAAAGADLAGRGYAAAAGARSSPRSCRAAPAPMVCLRRH